MCRQSTVAMPRVPLRMRSSTTHCGMKRIWPSGVSGVGGVSGVSGTAESTESTDMRTWQFLVTLSPERSVATNVAVEVYTK